MDSQFLSWDTPVVQSTTKINNDGEFLSWDRLVSVKKEQADDGDEVPKASFLSWDAPTPKSIRMKEFGSGKGNRYDRVNPNELIDLHPVHELLGSRIAHSHDREILWLNTLETKNVPWLAEHVFLDQILFPVSGYIAMVVEAANEMSDEISPSYILRDVSVTSALLLDQTLDLQLQTKLQPIENTAETGSLYNFQIMSSFDGSNWTERCVGRVSAHEIKVLNSTPNPDQEDSLVRYISREYWYDIVADSGLKYGSKFQNLDEITTSVTDLRADASSSAFVSQAKYILHPITIEQSFQILMVARSQGQGRKTRNISVPSYIDTLVITGASGKLRIGGKATETRLNGFAGDVSMVTNEGQPVLIIRGCRMSIVPINKQKVERKVFSTTEWSTVRLGATTDRAKKVTLLLPSGSCPLSIAIKACLQQNEIRFDTYSLEDSFPLGQDVISLLDLGAPYIYSFTEARFQNFVKKISGFKGRMIWVTPSAQIICKNPNTSMIIGLVRTLRLELRKDITTIEIDKEELNTAKQIVQIYKNLGNRTKSKDLDPDYEYAIYDGEVKTPRLHWTTTEEELAYSNNKSSANSNDNDSSMVPISFRSDACYLLVGGLGGLGREISRWMVENGARNILYLSRSAKEGPDTTPFFDELRGQDCSISIFAGSVNNLEDVEAAVRQATKPIAGVMQMSAVMRDKFLSQMTFSDWKTCVDPKVEGTWNLHHALSASSLDFFLLFSSICGITGQWGQANYNSANSFLDAFVKYRHGNGLAASVIDIGFMGGVGMAAENAALVSNLKKSGYHFLSEPELIDALSISITHSRPGDKKSQFALGITTTKPITDSSCRPAWKKDARMLEAHQFITPEVPHLGEVASLLDEALKNSSD
ncbi:polyketide synthase [Phlyctema vagabunda]|uniref:Polyketide synthase n=1 Tax=Phlyctema vagabunda TaxID=108571 RepID=A0ABR4P1B4_9HELO